MTETATELVSVVEGDAAEFVEIVQSLVMGLVHEQKPKRLYVIRIDNWFGPRWLKFAGKFTAGKHFYAGAHKKHLHVPPFVPSRVISERAFVSPDFVETTVATPLHINCPSMVALLRRIEQVDKDAVFLWFSSKSETQGRGAVMVYLPVVNNESGFYAGFAQQDGRWQPSMLRYISHGEIEGLQQLGRA